MVQHEPLLSSRQPRPPRWVQWIAPRQIDLVLLIWYGAVVLVTFADDAMSWQDTVWFNGVLLAMLVLERFDYWRFPWQRTRLAALLLIAAHLGLLLVLIINNWETALAFVVPFMPYIGFLYGGKQVGLWFSALAWAGLMSVIGMAWYGYITAYTTAFCSGPIMFAVFSFLLSMVVSSLTTVLDEQVQSSRVDQAITASEHAYSQQRLVAEHVLVEQEARNHLARDIHDGLGHYLTVINMQLEKALAFRAIDAVVADRALEDARRLTDDALREVHTSR